MLNSYNNLKKEVKKKYYSKELTVILTEIYSKSLAFLNDSEYEELISRIDGKVYHSYRRGNKYSRAINSNLFNPDIRNWEIVIEKMESNSFIEDDKELIQSTLYSIAISFCACVDILKSGDQKTPGTFFEYFVAYFFTWRVGTEPQNAIPILSIDNEQIDLPTDFIYNLGRNKQKFHMPVKTSSRERSIMIWAHQKLINGIYGDGRFMGTPVLLAETKLDKEKREVIEICLPDQWKLYQFYISKLTRIYYLDLPKSYNELNSLFPPIAVRQFADFFFEWNQLSPS